DHLVIVPVALPLLAAALMLLLDERRRVLRVAVSLISTFALAVVAIVLMRMVDAAPAGADASLVRVYRLGNWPAPFGIVLVLDRLSALMLVLTSMLACASLVYSLARWDRAGLYFHAMFQFLL